MFRVLLIVAVATSLWTWSLGSKPTGGGAIFLYRTADTGESKKSFNVRELGAKGDGIADDTAAIQAAINAAPNGSTIYFPPGTYLVSNFAVSGRAGLTFIGDGRRSLIKQVPDAERTATFSDASDIVLTKLAFDANGKESFGGVAFYGVRRVRIENTFVMDSAPKPVGRTDRFSFVFGKGSSPSQDIQILNNTIEDLQLEVDHSRRVVIEGNTVTRAVRTAGIGIFTVNDDAVSEDYKIIRNKIVDPLGSGFSVVVDPPNNRNCIFRRITIADNEVIQNKAASYGVRVGTLDNSQRAAGNVFEDITIRNNRIRIGSTAARSLPAIFANASADAGIIFKRLVVTGNEVHNQGTISGYAVDLRRVQHSLVSDNKIRGVTNGVSLGGDLLSNQIRNNVVDASEVAYALQGSLGNNKASGNSVIGRPKQRWRLSELQTSDAVQQ